MSTSEHGDLALSGVADEGLARWLADVRRLIAAGGADVRDRPHPGLVHGFLDLGQVSPAAAQATEGLFRD